MLAMSIRDLVNKKSLLDSRVYSAAQHLLSLVMILTSAATYRLIRLSFLCALTVGLALHFIDLHFSSLKAPRLFFVEAVRNYAWTLSPHIEFGEMSWQGTAIRLLNPTMQDSSRRAPLTKVHLGISNVSVLRATAAELQRRLEEGTITSESLVQKYLGQIEKHNLKGQRLHAMTSIASSVDLIDIARRLDAERQIKGPRSPLHGIPIVVKARVFADLNSQ